MTGVQTCALPIWIAYPFPGAGGEKLCRRLKIPLSETEHGRDASVYGNIGHHSERRCSRMLFDTSAKSLGSIEYEARPFVRERMAVA